MLTCSSKHIQQTSDLVTIKVSRITHRSVKSEQAFEVQTIKYRCDQNILDVLRGHFRLAAAEVAFFTYQESQVGATILGKFISVMPGDIVDVVSTCLTTLAVPLLRI